MKKITFNLFFVISIFAAFFPISKTSAQINLVNGLLAHYSFDGNTKSDAGSGWDLTNNGATLTTDHYGNANSAYFFNGSSYLQGNFPATGYSGITVSAWINTTYTSNNIAVLGYPSGATYLNRFSAKHFMSYFDQSSSNNASTDQSVSEVENGWTFIAATNDGSTTKLYVNGNLEHSYVESLVNGAGNGAMVVGDNYTSTTNYFHGSIDEVRVYSRPLNGDEILALYQMPRAAFGANNGCQGHQLSFTDSSNTIASSNTYLWKFGDNTTDNSKNPVHTYTKSGTFQVWQIVTSQAGSVDSTSRTVVVYPSPLAGFKTIISGFKVSFTPNDSTLTSYSWDFGDSNTSSSKKPNHVFAGKGTYKVTLKTTNTLGCDSTFTLLLTVQGSGIENLMTSDINFDLYPNPSNDGKITIKTNNFEGKCNLIISDMEGRILYNQQVKNEASSDRIIDIQGLKNGIYTARLQTGSALENKTFVVQ